MTPILNWIKANLAIVIMCAVMVVTLPAVVFVSGRMNSSLRESIKDRATKQDRELTTLQSTNLTIRPLVPGAPTLDEQVTLNDSILEQYRTLRERVKSDADELVATAIEINRSDKGVLVEGLLPAPEVSRQEELPFVVYGAYRSAHERLLDRLQAGMPLDPEELVYQLEDHDRNFRRAQFNREPGESLSDTEMEILEKEMAKRRLAIYAQTAADHSVYADLSVFQLDEWDLGQKPDPTQWWEWQQLYWIHADLVDAINLANQTDDKGLAYIEDDPGSAVKRIVSIETEREFTGRSRSVPRSRRGRGGRDEGGGEGGGEGAFFGESYETGEVMGPEGMMVKGSRGSRSKEKKKAESNFDDPSKPFTLDFTQSISGRPKHTALYDIRDVRMVLIVDARQIQTVLDAINQTSLMTVKGVQMNAIDNALHLANGFYYGSDPVVELTLVIESLWLRDWTVPLMPDEVKEHFEISTGEDEEDGG